MNLTEALAWLTAHVNLETGIGVPVGVDRRKVAPTLDRIRALTELLGSPQLEFPAVHLTGTNGKTSATRMVAALLDAVGLSTGSYTSPDLTRVNERMALRGVPIDDVELAAALSRVALVEEFVEDRPSYFEILTAAAFDWFAQEAVDVAVVEVGVGGTWDATTIVAGAGRRGDERERRPRRVPGRHPGRDREREERHRRAGRDARARRDRSRAVRDLRGARARRDHPARPRLLACARSGSRTADGSSTSSRRPGPYDDVFLPLHGAHQADNAVIALDRGGELPR